MFKKIRDFFEKRKLLREMVLYGLIGGTSAALDTVLTVALAQMGMNALVANIIGVLSGITLSFFLNTFINFRKTDKLASRALRFYGVGILGLFLSLGILVVGDMLLGYNNPVEFFGIVIGTAKEGAPGLDWNFIIVKLASVFIVAAFQYVLNKFLTFGGGAKTKSDNGKNAD